MSHKDEKEKIQVPEQHVHVHVHEHEQEHEHEPVFTYENEGIHTLFNVSGRNQLQQIQMADNKAIMITAICAALIFLIIAMFSSGFTLKGESPLLNSLEFVLPMGIMMAFSSVSIIFAVLALKPKIVRTKKEGRSALFFHNYYRMTLKEYKKEMHVIMNSNKHIYDHMIKDMYFNGLVLERKYALLGYSYSIFLISIVCSITSYVIAAVV